MPEEILLDQNKEAAKHSFYMVGGLSVSLDTTQLAYSEDTNGSEKYTIYVKVCARFSAPNLRSLPFASRCMPVS